MIFFKKDSNDISIAPIASIICIPVYFLFAVLCFSGCVPVDDHKELSHAYQEIQQGDYSSAKIRTELCLRNDNHNIEALLLNSLCQLKSPSGVLGISKALFNLEKATSLAPQRYDTWYYLGWGKVQCKKYREALPALEKALKLLPPGNKRREDILLLIVRCCIKNNLYTKGFQYLQPLRCLEQYASDPNFYNITAILALKRGDEHTAVSHFIQALKKDPSNATVLQNIAVYFDIYKAKQLVARDYYIRTIAALGDRDINRRLLIQKRLGYLAEYLRGK
ncbi:MAG: hypothetical protein WCS73_04705 [Lentisphaeria bacterium]